MKQSLVNLSDKALIERLQIITVEIEILDRLREEVYLELDRRDLEAHSLIGHA